MVDLTPRQWEILAFLASGIRAKEIAFRLSLSVATVRNHIHALLRELGVNSQLAAVAKARELGLSSRLAGPGSQR
jgi:DNA-binding NarL/FixJ family response regulator